MANDSVPSRPGEVAEAHRAAAESATAHVIVRTSCAHCHDAVELECKGLTGFWGYASYYEYLCPHCGKQNHERTTGTIVAARVVLGVKDARAAAHEPRR